MKPLPLPRSWTRARVSALAVVLAILLAKILQPWYHDNGEAHSVLITVFTVFAGFLLTAMTLVADGERGANWREATFHARLSRSELRRHIALLGLYLLILMLCFIDALHFPLLPTGQTWLERAILFLSVIALLASVELPMRLARAQIDRLNRQISRRRDHEKGRDNHNGYKRAA